MLRYSAHLPLKGIGAAGQKRIRDAHVALIGVGGLGCAVAQYLVSSGVGQLTLCDFDTVAESNLALVFARKKRIAFQNRGSKRGSQCP